MGDNLKDLTDAARLKLQAQKKYAQEVGKEDIYAEIRGEAAETEYETYPSLLGAPQNEENEEGLEFADDTDYNVENPIDMDDFQLYAGGPFNSQVQIWKKQYGAGHVYHIRVLERDFIFRTINRFEYKQLIAMENVDALMREEIICATCVLHPRKYDFKAMAKQDAGYPGTVAQIILESSGFTKEYGIEVL